MSVNESVFDRLRVLLDPSPPQVQELSILPSTFPPAIQFDAGKPGPALGIPKSILITCFCQARTQLLSALKNQSSPELQILKPGIAHAVNTPGWPPDNQDFASQIDLLRTTAVLLLQEPNHSTAANWRKRYLCSMRQWAALDDSKLVLQAEWAFLTSLLTSPLPPAHAKSPTLWFHRLWLLRTFLFQQTQLVFLPRFEVFPASKARGDLSFQMTLRFDWWRTELEIVQQAGARHPRNYYSWAYARDLWALLLSEPDIARLQTQGGRREVGLDAGFERPNIAYWQQDAPSRNKQEAFISETIDSMHQWCFRHPRDVSGWSFLLFQLQHVPASTPGNTHLSMVNVLSRRTAT